MNWRETLHGLETAVEISAEISTLIPRPRNNPFLILALLLFGVVDLAAANDPPEVTNVLAQQREGTMLVDVTYDLHDPDGDPMTASLRLSEDGGQSFTIVCVTLSGDIGPGVMNGSGKHIAWDAGVDYPGHVGDDYVVKVIADDGQTPPGMVLVPAGTFIMGDGEAYCGEDEHWVTLTRDFYLGQHEVTNQEYLEAVQWAYDHGYVTATTSSVRDNLDGSTQELLDLDDVSCEISFSGGIFSLRDAGHGINPDHPVIEVTWYGAVRYCDWLSLQAGLARAYEHTGSWACGPAAYPDSLNPYAAEGYRLPTDAEWEYAAQWDDERIYPWGDEEPDCGRANYADCVNWTSPAGSYPDAPGALGLSDMAGNVWEWCNDWWVCDLGTGSQTDPTGPGGSSHRVLRGGSWSYVAAYLRCAYRNNPIPSSSNNLNGFRIARTVSAP